MSSIEEQLARDIAAVRGVVVTESDLRDARSEVERRRIDSRGCRRTVATAAAAAVVIPALGFAAFQTLSGEDKSAPPANSGPTTPADVDADFLTGNAPTPQLIDGLWRVLNGALLMLFDVDGTMRFDKSGMLYSNPAVPVPTRSRVT